MQYLIESAAMKSFSQTSHTDQAPAFDFPKCLTVILSWTAVAIIAIFIFWMSSKDGTTVNEGSGIFSAIKAWLSSVAQSAFGHPVDVSPVGHFCEYLALGMALANALRHHIPTKRAAVLAMILASAYGISDEIHQLFVPQRSCDPADWAVDTIAAIIGSALVSAICTRHARRTSS